MVCDVGGAVDRIVAYVNNHPVILCDCGGELVCWDFTNECDCGSAYNFAGQALRDVSDWSDYELAMGLDN